MTTKEIAAFTGKPEQTVRNWVRALASKSDAVKSKLDASSPMKPADYDLNETCLIIEQGMGADVANVYRTNAATAEMQKQTKTKLPSGAQMTALERLYGQAEAVKRIDFAMGYKPVETVYVTKDLGRISKPAYAVEMKERQKKQLQIEARKSPSLFDQEASK